MNPFDFVASINHTKENIMVDELSEKTYNPWLTNRALSYFIDTCLQANEMNARYHVPKHAQYAYLLNTVRAKKRFAGKWHKNEADATIELIMRYHGYSFQKAKQIADILTANNLEQMKKAMDEGGV
jgi:hypothetical protein